MNLKTKKKQSKINQNSIENQLKFDPKSIENRLKIDPTSTQHRRKSPLERKMSRTSSWEPSWRRLGRVSGANIATSWRPNSKELPPPPGCGDRPRSPASASLARRSLPPSGNGSATDGQPHKSGAQDDMGQMGSCAHSRARATVAPTVPAVCRLGSPAEAFTLQNARPLGCAFPR